MQSQPTLSVSLPLSYLHIAPKLMNPPQVNGTRYAERDMLNLFLGTCLAVRAMHHHVSGPQPSYPPSASPRMSPSAVSLHGGKRRGGIRVVGGGDTTEEEDDDDDGPSTGLKGVGEGETLLSGGDLENVKEELEEEEGHGEGLVEPRETAGTEVPWAHRDIKPVRSAPFLILVTGGADRRIFAGQHNDRRRR